MKNYLSRAMLFLCLCFGFASGAHASLSNQGNIPYALPYVNSTLGCTHDKVLAVKYTQYGGVTLFFYYGCSGYDQNIVYDLTYNGGTIRRTPTSSQMKTTIFACWDDVPANCSQNNQTTGFTQYEDPSTNYLSINNTIYDTSSGIYLAEKYLYGTEIYVPLVLSQFPVDNGDTPYDAPINSVFDHHMTTPYGVDNTVIAFTGDTGARANGYSDDCYENSGHTNFSFHGYIGANGASYLCYDGHPAIDYDYNLGTPIEAPAAGIVIEVHTNPSDNCLGRYVRIDHGQGYETVYGHLNSIESGITVTTSVSAGELLGESGNSGTCTSGAHLHFEVRFHGTPVDPYGWDGGGSDPYTAAINWRLWP